MTTNKPKWYHLETRNTAAVLFLILKSHFSRAQGAGETKVFYSVLPTSQKSQYSNINITGWTWQTTFL